MAERVVETVLIGLDRQRFPWVVERRDPAATEREAATLSSAALMATQRVSTMRRHEGKTRQEEAVAMLSGVFKRHNLVQAQEAGLTLFWAYALGDFLAWIASTQP